MRHPEHWAAYYRGSPEEVRRKRAFSYSDRCRYYWPRPEVQEALAGLLRNLSERPIPEPLIDEFLPESSGAVREGRLPAEPVALIRHHIQRVLDVYAAACGGEPDRRELRREIEGLAGAEHYSAYLRRQSLHLAHEDHGARRWTSGRRRMITVPGRWYVPQWIGITSLGRSSCAACTACRGLRCFNSGIHGPSPAMGRERDVQAVPETGHAGEQPGVAGEVDAATAAHHVPQAGRACGERMPRAPMPRRSGDDLQ